jgi:D-alanine-D-alanine ligase-like ATP-grasp enzyme
VFAALGCEGISRIDFLIDADDGALYFNEINTLRSLANISGLRHRVLDDPTC